MPSSMSKKVTDCTCHGDFRLAAVVALRPKSVAELGVETGGVRFSGAAFFFVFVLVFIFVL